MREWIESVKTKKIKNKTNHLIGATQKNVNNQKIRRKIYKFISSVQLYEPVFMAMQIALVVKAAF